MEDWSHYARDRDPCERYCQCNDCVLQDDNDIADMGRLKPTGYGHEKSFASRIFDLGGKDGLSRAVSEEQAKALFINMYQPIVTDDADTTPAFDIKNIPCLADQFAYRALTGRVLVKFWKLRPWDLTALLVGAKHKRRQR